MHQRDVKNVVYFQTITGDTLVSSLRSAVAASKSYHRTLKLQSGKINDTDEYTFVPLILAGMTIPRPVFFCSIEPPSIGFQKQLDKALEILAREDPSLQVSYEKDTGQTILGGMGELHLEVIHDRIKKVCCI
jgi:elongation factor G